MVTLGWLLLLGTTALSVAAIWTNQDVFVSSAGVVELLGYQAEPSVAQIFGAGAIASALVIFSLWMILSGLRRRSRRNAAVRRSAATKPAPASAPVAVPADRGPEAEPAVKDEEAMAKR